MMQEQSVKISRVKVDLAMALWRLHDLKTKTLINREFTREEIEDGCDFLGDTLSKVRRSNKPKETFRAPTWKLFANQSARSETDHELMIIEHELRIREYYDNLKKLGTNPPVEAKDEHIKINDDHDDEMVVRVLSRMIEKISKQRTYGKRRNTNLVIH